MNIYCCSFASKKFIDKQKRQKEYFLKSGFKRSEIFDNSAEVLDQDFLNRQPEILEILNKGGVGGFTFKPYFIQLILNELKDNDILIYLDVNDKPLFGIREYLLQKFNKSPSLNILTVGTNYSNIRHLSSFHKKNFSRELLFSSLVCAQPEAGFVAVRNNPTTRSILKSWYEFTFINYIESENNILSRYDQETLFLLSRCYKSIKIESWLLYKLFGKGVRKYIKFEFLR